MLTILKIHLRGTSHTPKANSNSTQHVFFTMAAQTQTHTHTRTQTQTATTVQSFACAMQLTGRIVIVTGGASNIGRQIVLQFAREGAVVCVCVCACVCLYVCACVCM